MKFKTEPAGYEKTVFSDLQGAWENLRVEVVEKFGFPNSDKLIFHIDEAMSWESVRNLNQMKSTLLLIQNLAAQSKSPEEIIDWINDVRVELNEAFEEIS